MRRSLQGHFINALFGVLDYAAWPIGMVLVAPVMLHHLGTARYGVWAVAAAIVSAGSILASGFGDANIQHVASSRGAGQSQRLLRTVRSSMGIHLVLGLAMALLTWIFAPLVAAHVVHGTAALRRDCLLAVRIASLIILARALETVCVSTQRAFERYGSAVNVSIAGRLLSLLLAGVLAYLNQSVASILGASLVVILFSVWLQMRGLRVLLHADSLRPLFDVDAVRTLFAFGIFSWLQALASVVIGQADRLIAGVTMGAVAVASYALCVQIAQPLYGIVSSGLHFLFPHLAARRLALSRQELRRLVVLAFLANLVLVAIGSALLLAFGPWILRILAGPVLATSAGSLLPFVVWSTAVLSLSVTAYYALMAFDRIRIVTFVNLTASAAMLASMAWLVPSHSLVGIAMARFVYAFVALLLYWPLVSYFVPDLTARSRDLRRDPGVPFPAASLRQPTHANVLGVRIEALNMSRALQRVASVLHGNQKGYVSVIGVHGIMEAQRNPRLAAIYANSAITIPDGMPTVWVGRLQGCRQMQRVAGPDLMLEIFRNPQFARCTHYLYGGDPGVAQALATNLRRWFPWARIVGAFTPPYRELTLDEEHRFITAIGRLQPDFIWVGISAPRQEAFMARYLPLLDTKLMFGVGAAFDYHTGRIKDCSEWIKRAGLQWLHRLLQDPCRLWRRYLRNNPAFLWHITLQLTGLRRYETSPAESLPAATLVPRPVARRIASDTHGNLATHGQ
jgi:exopolysaccharide biosynthesis WecB/TagA/CpsF family protein